MMDSVMVDSLWAAIETLEYAQANDVWLAIWSVGVMAWLLALSIWKQKKQ